jgi:diaminopimelate epimerase
MSGSGNDFVMVDARIDGRGRLGDTSVIQRICARGTGVGADGIVFLEPSDQADIRLTYINADGSRADFCGNATLCTTRLALELGVGSSDALEIQTDSGIVSARLIQDLPEIDLQPVSDVRPEMPDLELRDGERRIGFALVGVPHLVIEVADISLVDVVGRGRPLRHHGSLPFGANVNFVSKDGTGRWRYRTYERGVEAETLACGSGAVAAGILLTVWGGASDDIELETRSGRPLRVRLRRSNDAWYPSLSGEGRVVFKGELAEV